MFYKREASCSYSLSQISLFLWSNISCLLNISGACRPVCRALLFQCSDLDSSLPPAHRCTHLLKPNIFSRMQLEPSRTLSLWCLQKSLKKLLFVLVLSSLPCLVISWTFVKKYCYLPLSAFKQRPQIDYKLFEGKNYSYFSGADKALVWEVCV